MEIKDFKKYENKTIKVFLKNEYSYVLDSIKIKNDSEIEGFDNKRREIVLDAGFIVGVVPLEIIENGSKTS